MDVLKGEFSRNVGAYFLVLAAVTSMVLGAHIHLDKLVDTGYAFAMASLAMFQAKRTPDGNTTTTSVTVPPPAVADPVVADPKQ